MTRLDWKRRIGRLFGGLTASKHRTVVLLYHSIGESQLAVPEPLFREQIAWLSERATIVPLKQVVEPQLHPGMQVAITFDDGYASLHDRVAPILAEHGATATVYLNTGWIGETQRKASDAALGHYPQEYFMNWREAAALAKAGWTIGSHGVEHLDLTQQEHARIMRELGDSRNAIETRLGQPCENFAYTWGRFTSELKHNAKLVGYLTAVSGLHGPVSAGSDRFALPRIDIRAEYELRDFVDAVTGRWDFLGFKQRLARRLA